MIKSVQFIFFTMRRFW